MPYFSECYIMGVLVKRKQCPASSHPQIICRLHVSLIAQMRAGENGHTIMLTCRILILLLDIFRGP